MNVNTQNSCCILSLIVKCNGLYFKETAPPCGCTTQNTPCTLTLVVSKEANPISFIISISSSVLPCMSSAVKKMMILNQAKI